MITRNGVYYDLKNSCFRTKLHGMVFVFSSKMHLEKFLSKLAENRDYVNKSLSNRFNYPVNVDVLADMVLYRKIESRGFLIEINGIEVTPQTALYTGGAVELQTAEQ